MVIYGYIFVGFCGYPLCSDKPIWWFVMGPPKKHRRWMSIRSNALKALSSPALLQRPQHRFFEDWRPSMFLGGVSLLIIVYSLWVWRTRFETAKLLKWVEEGLHEPMTGCPWNHDTKLLSDICQVMNFWPDFIVNVRSTISRVVRLMDSDGMFEGSLEVKLPTIWTDEKQRWEESERREE